MPADPIWVTSGGFLSRTLRTGKRKYACPPPPFVCTGHINSLTTVPAKSGSTPEARLRLTHADSRFGVPTSYTRRPCVRPGDSTADINVKEYVLHEPGGSSPDQCLNNPPAGSPRDWMDPTAAAIRHSQGITIINRVPVAKNSVGRSNRACIPP